MNLCFEAFKWATAQLNEFNLNDAPNSIVFETFVEYRELSATVCPWVSPAAPTTDSLLVEFSAHITQLQKLKGALEGEAKRLGAIPLLRIK